jgi:hypothetical protein
VQQTVDGEGLGENWETSGPWVKPDALKAREHFKGLLFWKGIAPFWGTSINELGVGMLLHFRLVKYMVSEAHPPCTLAH